MPKNSNPRQRPGQKAPRSGQYAHLDANGKRTGREVTVVKGEPPPPKKRQSYRPADPTTQAETEVGVTSPASYPVGVA